MSKQDISLWSVRVACGIGFAKYAKLETDNNKELNDLLWTAEIGFLNFQSGQYYTAAKQFHKHAMSRIKNQHWDDAAIYFLHSSNAWKEYGNVMRYFINAIYFRILTIFHLSKSEKAYAIYHKWKAEYFKLLLDSIKIPKVIKNIT